MLNRKGKLIICDGPEGSGKSSLITFLKDKLKDKPFLFTREPGGTQSGIAIRAVCLDPKYKLCNKAIMLMMLADRHQHLEEIILPWLNNSTNVISDRYESSTYAYQGYAHNNLGMVTDLMKDEYLKVKKPDIFIHLDVEAEEGLKRSFSSAVSAGKENELRFEKEGVDFFNRVRKGFYSYAEFELPIETYKKNYLRIDTTNQTQESIQEEVYNFIITRV